MAVLILVGSVFGSIAVAVFADVFADELKAWLPWLTRKLLRKAVRRLPEERRDRYEEEWASSISEVPGEIGKLIYSLGLSRAASGILRLSRPSSSSSLVTLAVRVIDISLASIILVFLSWPIALIALAVRLSSRGQIIVFTLGVNHQGKPYQMLNFRVFRMPTHEGPCTLVPTPVGKFLVKHSLESLPWLLNVIKGDISLLSVIRFGMPSRAMRWGMPNVPLLRVMRFGMPNRTMRWCMKNYPID